MPDICFYFQVHQPYRLRRYRVFDIGTGAHYFDNENHVIEYTITDPNLPPGQHLFTSSASEFEAAKAYILYRAEHAKQRKERPIPEDVRAAFAESDTYFPTQLQKFQFYDKYSRFSYESGRRETWVETVDRAVDYLRELSASRLPAETYARVRQGMLEMRAMSSMRLLAMAGPAAQQLAGIEYYSLDDLVEFKRPGAACRPDSCAEQEVEKELRRFKRFCIERNVVTLLEEAQLRRREFIQHQIPALVANELGELDARMRKQVEALMKQLISDYSVESFNSIHKALEQYWSGK